ncbi:MAG: glycosyltransferase family 1 protein [Leptolyngbyaceae bacterium]|nr:glycosyltransferase family 1 protein [Leptolyngbyaceae bacterium]
MLDGKRIVVDGYNLQLSQGTGVKTYGISLIKALQTLGADISVLFGRDVPNLPNALLSEILFFDIHEGQDKNRITRNPLVQTASNAVGASKIAAGVPVKANQVTTSDVVVKGAVNSNFIGSVSSFIDQIDIFNAATCFDKANGTFKLLKRPSVVQLPQDVVLFHATYPLPLSVKGAKKLTTIHDLIPLRLPYTTLDDKKFYYRLIRNCLEDSDRVITVSESSKQDILSIFDIDPDRVDVTYQPIALKPLSEEEGTEEAIAKYLRQYDLTPKNYILFVGAIEPKKNVGRLIDAYAGLDTDMPLVIVGKKGWLWEDELKKVGMLNKPTKAHPDGVEKVRLLEYLRSNDLRYLYSGAFCFVFPSLYEGFGLPPLEAMSFGCPVITSNVSSLPEVCGDAALYVDPYDVNDIRKTMEKLMSSEFLPLKLIHAGYQQAQKFSAEHYVEKLSQAYAKVL